jgi:hypothetical protein
MMPLIHHNKEGEPMRIYFTLTLAALALFTLPGNLFAGSTMHVNIAKEHCNAMIVSGEDALDHGQQGHAGAGVKHLKKMIHEAEECVNHGEGGINASDASKDTQMHGPEAMDHVKEAISHARSALKHGLKDHVDIMIDHTKDALAHAYEGNKHAKEMN